MNLAVLGAGPAGLCAALEAQQGGARVRVFEKDPVRVGGLSQTAEYRGYRFDIGGHRFFSKNPDIEALWTELLGDEMLLVPRSSRIYYGGRFYDYPLKPWNALRNLGGVEAVRCLLSFAWARLHPQVPVRSFEDWVVNQFGRRLFEIFFKTYTEKVWGESCQDISADWAAQRIKGLSLGSAVLSALGWSGGGSPIKTLVDQFRYPRLGPGQMWEAAADRLRQAGGELLMGHGVTALHRGYCGVTSVRAGGQDFACDAAISSIPIRHLIRALQPAAPPEVAHAAQGLRYRDFLTVVLLLKDRNYFPDNWIYIHEPNVKVGRIQNYKNWSAAMVPDPTTTALGLEYFCFRGDGLWQMSEEQLVNLARRELQQLGLAGPEDFLGGTVVRMPKAYPVYDHDYRHKVSLIRAWLEEHVPNLQLVGRNGMHRYNNQDHAMLTGIFAARNALGLGSYDLWKVNEDAEYLEEAGPAQPGGRLQPEVLGQRYSA